MRSVIGTSEEVNRGPQALPCLFVLTPSGPVPTSSKKRGEPAPASAPPAAAKLPKIDLRSVKVGMVGRKSYEAKKAECLHQNLQAMIKKHGVERIVLCTLTFANDPKCMRAAQRRFDSINSNLLGELFLAHVTAVHRGTKRGRIHYHLIAVCKEDVRTGFDFEAWNRLLAHVHLFGRHNAQYRALCGPVFGSANPALKAIWKTFRDRAEGYGFGMVETYPVRSNAEAVGRYVGSYVRTAAENRQFRDKRMRTIRYSMGKGQRVASAQFSWLNGPAALWRKGCALFSLLCGVDDLALMFGKRWAWDLRKEITLLGRHADRATHKLYEVAEGMALLGVPERRAQVGEFCRRLAEWEAKEAANV